MTSFKYALWDQTHVISNRYLKKYIQDIDNSLAHEFDSFVKYHDLDAILEASSNHHYLIVMTSGHTLKSPKVFLQATQDFCRDDFLVAGQIIYHVNDYPFLHPQLFIINMKLYNQYGRPMIGFHEDSDVLDLHRPSRSKENVHDDYTPLWLKPSGEVVSYVRRDFAWNLIHESLNHGLTVPNLSGAIRHSKRFIYPAVFPHTFAECLEKLSKGGLKRLPKALDYNQRAYLTERLDALS